MKLIDPWGTFVQNHATIAITIKARKAAIRIEISFMGNLLVNDFLIIDLYTQFHYGSLIPQLAQKPLPVRILKAHKDCHKAYADRRLKIFRLPLVADLRPSCHKAYADRR